MISMYHPGLIPSSFSNTPNRSLNPGHSSDTSCLPPSAADSKKDANLVSRPEIAFVRDDPPDAGHGKPAAPRREDREAAWLQLDARFCRLDEDE
jgi:hypothetical protein